MYCAVPPPENTTEKSSSAAETITDEKPPRNVSEQTWKKFQELKERRRKCCKTSADKRIKGIKKEVTKTVFEEMQTPEELSMLKDCGVSKPKHLRRSGGAESGKHRKDKIINDAKWSDLKQNFYLNPQFKGVEKGHSAPKSKLEEDCEAAVSAGDFELAEQLNNELVQRDFATKVAAAVECRDYLKRKSKELDNARTKKKKLHWAFEQKHRWESKGNM